MKSVLYIGNNETGALFEKTAKERKIDLRSISGNNLTANDVVTLALDINIKYYAAIINLFEIPKAVEQLEYIIEEILGEDTVKLCIMCPGCSLDDEQIELCLNLGVQFYMIYLSDKDNIKTFKKLVTPDCSSNINDIISYNEPAKSYNKPSDKNIAKQDISPENNQNLQNVEVEAETIAVGSCTPRMGATTIAIHLLKTLSTNNLSVCYVDSTMDSEYMQAFYRLNFIKENFDKEHHKLSVNGIDFFANVDSEISNYVLSQDYNYILYDFGCIRDNTKKLNAFVSLDYKILIGGAECNELQHLFEAYSKLVSINNDINLFLNLVKKDEEKKINELISNKLNITPFFFPYVSKYKTHPKSQNWIGSVFNIENKE